MNTTREIKFRAWENNRMYNDLAYVSMSGKAMSKVPDTPLIKPILMQFTGLKDKNGKEIYEGDILKYTRTKWRCSGHPEDGKDLIHFCEVYWNDKHCGFWEQMWGAREKRVFSSGPLIFEDNRAGENIIIVIGNIYENPELLIHEHI